MQNIMREIDLRKKISNFIQKAEVDFQISFTLPPTRILFLELKQEKKKTISHKNIFVKPHLWHDGAHSLN